MHQMHQGRTKLSYCIIGITNQEIGFFRPSTALFRAKNIIARRLLYSLIIECCIIEILLSINKNANVLIIEEFGFGREIKESGIYYIQK